MVVAGAVEPASRPAEERRKDLVALYRYLKECHECPLAESRTKLVFGSGNADANLMFVGEAPGFHEDQQGLPFVGRAGRLLEELLAEIGLERREVFICNVLKCRPPGNRDPLPDEVEECTPHLMRQIELIEPRVICTLGNFSTKLLTGSRRGIMSVRGRVQERELAGRSVRLYPLCHPAAALRSDTVRQQLREDFHGLPQLIAEPLPAAAPAAPLEDAAAVAGSSGACPEREPSEQARQDGSQLDLFG